MKRVGLVSLLLPGLMAQSMYTGGSLTVHVYTAHVITRLQRGRRLLVRVQPPGHGWQRQREPGRVLRQGGAADQRGDLLRVRRPVPRHECTQGHLRWGLRDPRGAQR